MDENRIHRKLYDLKIGIVCASISIGAVLGLVISLLEDTSTLKKQNKEQTMLIKSMQTTLDTLLPNSSHTTSLFSRDTVFHHQ